MRCRGSDSDRTGQDRAELGPRPQGARAKRCQCCRSTSCASVLPQRRARARSRCEGGMDLGAICLAYLDRRRTGVAWRGVAWHVVPPSPCSLAELNLSWSLNVGRAGERARRRGAAAGRTNPPQSRSPSGGGGGHHTGSISMGVVCGMEGRMSVSQTSIVEESTYREHECSGAAIQAGRVRCTRARAVRVCALNFLAPQNIAVDAE